MGCEIIAGIRNATNPSLTLKTLGGQLLASGGQSINMSIDSRMQYYLWARGVKDGVKRAMLSYLSPTLLQAREAAGIPVKINFDFASLPPISPLLKQLYDSKPEGYWSHRYGLRRGWEWR